VSAIVIYLTDARHACRTMGGERTVKRLRLSRALTVPESTTVLEVCRRMAARRADAALLTDSNALLCGILTDKVGPGLALRVLPLSKKISVIPPNHRRSWVP